MVGYKGNIITIPNPILRKKSKNLKLSEINKIRLILKDMVDLLDYYDGLGLSAVQVGLLKNFFIIRRNLEKEKIDLNNWLDEIDVYINPEILEYSPEQQENWEGCLSIPGIECLVSRSKKIKVRYLDLNYNEVIDELFDFKAVVFQHEFDHTKGILIIDKAKEIREVGE